MILVFYSPFSDRIFTVEQNDYFYGFILQQGDERYLFQDVGLEYLCHPDVDWVLLGDL